MEVRKSALSLLGNDVPDQENSQCKGPKVRIYLSCSKNSKLGVQGNKKLRNGWMSRGREVKEAT